MTASFPREGSRISMEWSRCRLGDSDVATVIMGQSPDSATYNSTGTGRPFFQGKADFGIRYPTARTWCSAPTRVAESGDILLSVRAPVGDVNIAREKCCIGRGLAAIRPGPGVVGGFLFYLLLYRKPELDALGSGAIFRAVNRDTLHDFQFELPQLEEQRRIAVVLAKIQDVIEVQERFVATLKELKAATMAKLFRAGLRGEPLKQTEIGEIPESWDIVALGSIARIGNGSTPKRDNPSYWTNATIPWLTSGKVHESVIERADEFVSEQARVECHLPLVRRNSLVVAITGEGKTLGNTAMVRFDTCVSQHLAYIQFETDRVVPEFVLFYLQGRYVDLRQASQAGGSTKRALTCGFLKTYLVPVPPVADQKEVANTLGTLVRILICEEARRQALGTLFFSMLRLLMTGEVRVRVERRVSDAAVRLEAQVGTAAEEKVSAPVEHFVARLVRRFEPDRMILFGSSVAGSPRAFGDVGLLVETPFRGLARDEAARIAREIPHDFSLDLLVRRPEELRRAREIGDRYLGGILERGRVLYAWPSGAPGRQPAEVAVKLPRRPPQVLSEETLNAIVRRIVETAAPEQIVMFGSAARGEMGPDSDVDLLVVKTCTDRRAVAQTIRKHLVGVAPGLPKDIVVVTPEDVERDRDTIGYIIRPALREGRVVYAA